MLKSIFKDGKWDYITVPDRTQFFIKEDGDYTIMKIVDITGRLENGKYPIQIKKFRFNSNYGETNLFGPIPTRNGYEKILDITHNLNTIKMSWVLYYLLKNKDPHLLHYSEKECELVIDAYALEQRRKKIEKVKTRIKQQSK